MDHHSGGAPSFQPAQGQEEPDRSETNVLNNKPVGMQHIYIYIGYNAIAKDTVRREDLNVNGSQWWGPHWWAGFHLSAVVLDES